VGSPIGKRINETGLSAAEFEILTSMFRDDRGDLFKVTEAGSIQRGQRHTQRFGLRKEAADPELAALVGHRRRHGCGGALQCLPTEQMSDEKQRNHRQAAAQIRQNELGQHESRWIPWSRFRSLGRSGVIRRQGHRAFRGRAAPRAVGCIGRTGRMDGLNSPVLDNFRYQGLHVSNVLTCTLIMVYLEDELAAWIGPGAERLKSMTANYYGLDGEGEHTLEEVGQHFGVKRQRVKQVIDKCRPDPKRGSTVVLRKALECVVSSAPIRREKAETALFAAGFVKRPFRLSGLLQAAKLAGIAVPFEILAGTSDSLVIDTATRPSVKALLAGASKRLRRDGGANVRELTEAQSLSLPWAVTILECQEGFQWLDRSAHLFCIGDNSEAPLVRRVRDILSVAVAPLSGECILEAAKRDFRMRATLATADLVRGVCRRLACAREVDGGFEWDPGQPREDPGDTVDMALVKIIRAHGDVAHHSVMKTEFLRQGGLPSSFGSVLTKSIFLVHHSPEVYGIIGSKPGQGETVDPVGSGPKSSLFAELDPGSPEVVKEFVARVLGGLGPSADLNPNRWSIAELRLSQADRNWLHRWGAEGHPVTAAGRQRTFVFRDLQLTGSEAAGGVFLFFCAEVARQRLLSSELWPFIFESLHTELRKSLIAQNSQPKNWLREGCEGFCRKTGMRHVFGTEGVMAWLRTIHLQFAISGPSWQRLPFWLSGQPVPAGVDELLKTDSSLYSESFARLWNMLQECRGDAESQRSAAALIRRSPWVLPEERDLVLELASASSRPEVESGTLPEDEEARFLISGASLEWHGEEPRFHLAVSPWLPSWATETEYRVCAADDAAVRVLRQPAGDYEALGDLDVGCNFAAIEVRVEAGEAIVLPPPLTYSIVTGEDDVVLFDLRRGRRLDPWSEPRANKPTALLAGPDLQVEPEPPVYRKVFGGTWTLYRFDDGVPADLKVTLDGNPIWANPVAEEAEDGEKAESFTAFCAGGRWLDRVPVSLHVPEDITPVRLTGEGWRLRIKRDDSGKWRTPELLLEPGVTYRDGTARLEGFQNGRFRHWRIRVTFGVVTGLGIQSEQGWAVLDGGVELDRSEMRTAKWLVRPPSKREWAILEGTRFVGRPNASTDSYYWLLNGFGGELVLRTGPYNMPRAPEYPLAAAVTDSGALCRACAVEDGWSLRLRGGANGAGRVAVWRWSSGSVEPQLVAADALAWDGPHCHVRDDYTEACVALAVTLDGEWVGCRPASAGAWRAMAGTIRSTQEWPRLARALRQWRIPVLHRMLRPAVCARSFEQPMATFQAWASLGDEGDEIVGWDHIIREFLWNWRPDETEAAGLAAAFGLLADNAETGVEFSWSGYEALLRIHPLLFVSCAIARLNQISAGHCEAERTALLHDLVNRLEKDGVSQRDRDAGLKEDDRTVLARRAIADLSVDESFLKKTLYQTAEALWNGTGAADSRHERNLKVAVQEPAFTHWIAAELLRSQLPKEQA
jgi:hypothetical protein